MLEYAANMVHTTYPYQGFCSHQCMGKKTPCPAREYVANTLIFVLAGVIISNRVHTSSVGQSALVNAPDYGYALLLWVYLLVRALPLHGPRSIRAHLNASFALAGGDIAWGSALRAFQYI